MATRPPYIELQDFMFTSLCGKKLYHIFHYKKGFGDSVKEQDTLLFYSSAVIKHITCTECLNNPLLSLLVLKDIEL